MTEEFQYVVMPVGKVLHLVAKLDRVRMNLAVGNTGEDVERNIRLVRQVAEQLEEALKNRASLDEATFPKPKDT